MNNNEMDMAIDFAKANKRSNAFCGRMSALFDIVGYLTDSQIKTLLKIKAAK